MTYSSSLDSNLTSLVLDTSVLINLHMSTYGEEILSALPNDVYISSTVASEMEYDPQKTNKSNFIYRILERRFVEIVDLNDQELDIFEKLISGSPSLDDGEASTIALAANRKFLPVIDERKGRAWTTKFIPRILPSWSLDLFLHSRVQKHLKEDKILDAIYLALRDGRMRIDEGHCEDVVKIIGSERAISCNSLPNYKSRREKWLSERALREKP